MTEEQSSIRAVAPKETKLIKVNQIEVGFRSRKELGNLRELAESIKTKGLINPITVKETADSVGYYLLAGDRRLRACKLLELTEVMCNVYPADLSQLEKDLIELCENIDRQNMTDEEELELTKRIHNTLQKLHGKKKGGRHQEGHSAADTAKILGRSATSISRDLKLAEAMEVIPELRKCKNRHEAEKVLKGLVKEHKRHEAAKMIDSERADTPEGKIKKALADSFIVGDFFEGVKNVPDSSVDLVEVDTPYAINLDSQKKARDGQNLKVYNEWSAKDFKSKIARVASECYRAMTEDSWLIWWFAWEPWFEVVYQVLIDAGFAGNRIPGIWIKPTGQCNHPDIYMASSAEPFFYMRKGNPTIERQGRANHFQFRPVSPEKKVHATEKPIELMCDIYSTFVGPGRRIMIPFLGSGNGIIAAHTVKCSAFGWDNSIEHKDGFIVNIEEKI